MPRLVWTILPAILLGASAASAGTPVAAPAQLPADRVMDIAATDLPGDAPAKSFPVIVDGPATDLGVAAAALANGPVPTAARKPAPGAGRANVTARSKARLPEPATWVMLIGGMYGIGAALRRRHRAAEAAFTARLRQIAAGEDGDDKQ